MLRGIDALEALGISSQIVHNWIKRPKPTSAKAEALTSDECDKLLELRNGPAAREELKKVEP